MRAIFEKVVLAVVFAMAGFANVSAAEGQEAGEARCYLEYIASTGSQVLTTDFYPTPKTKVVLSLKMEGTYQAYGSNGSFMGCSSGNDVFSLNFANNSQQVYCWTDKAYPAGAIKQLNAYTTITSSRNTLVFQPGNLGSVSWGSSSVKTANKTATMEAPLNLFGNSPTVPFQRFKMVLYSCQIFDDGDLVRDYVPCLTTTGKTGLYEKFSGDVLVSEGADFEGGPVTGPVWGEVMTVASSDPDVDLSTPRAGVVYPLVGEELSFSCPSLWTNEAKTVVASCQGFQLELADGETIVNPALSTNIVYSSDLNGSRLTWLWDHAYRMTASAQAGLSVSVSKEWVDEGDEVTFTATSAGSTFGYWVGDVPDASRFDASFTCAAQAPMSLEARTIDSVITVKDDGTGDYPTIEAALEAVADGGVIGLEPGEYSLAGYEGIVVPQGVMLMGRGDDPSQTRVTAYSASAGDTASASLVTVYGRVENITFSGARSNNDADVPRTLVAADGALVTNCVFTGQRIKTKGYVAHITGAGTRFTASTISDVLVTGGGGNARGESVLVDDGAVVEGSVFSGLTNHVGTQSAQVRLSTGARILRSTVSDCRTTDSEHYMGCSGGLVVDPNGDGCLVEDCVIEGNSICSDTWGDWLGSGGLSVLASATVRRTVVRGNVSEQKTVCGGVYCTGAATFENVLIVGNRVTSPKDDAKACGGIYVGNDNAVLRHVTVSGNRLMSVSANHRAHGAVLDGAQAVNSIFYGNGPSDTAGSSFNLAVSGPAGCVVSSIATSLAECANAANADSGADCRAADPMFTSPSTGDYTLQGASPALDCGRYIGLDHDIRGVARPQNDGYDLGAYECRYEKTYECSISPLTRYLGVAGGTARFSYVASQPSQVAEATWRVTALPSGEEVSTGGGQDVALALPAGEGTYEVALKVRWNDGHEETADPSATVRVVGAVSVRNGDELAGILAQMEGLSPENPVTVNLEDAVYTRDAATACDWMFDVGSGVVLKGPSDGTAVLDGQSVHRVLRLREGARACGLVLTNATAVGSQGEVGFFADIRGGVLEDCVIEGGRRDASLSSVVEHGVYLGGGCVSGCTVRDIANPAVNRNCGAIVYVAAGTVTNTLIAGNSFTYSAGAALTLATSEALGVDCVVCSNSAGHVDYSNYAAGGVSALNGGRLVASCVFDNSYRYGNGYYGAGGVNAYGEGSLVDRCVVSGNKASYAQGNFVTSLAGGVQVRGGATLRSSLVTDNQVFDFWNAPTHPVGGGVDIAGSGTVLNCTIVGNSLTTSGNGGGGVSLEGGRMVNTIVWDNAAGTGSDLALRNCFVKSDATPTVTCVCTSPAFDGEGNTGEDPKFKKGYRIRSSSPCANAGDPTGWTEDDADLAGKPRLHKDGRVDIGCYQATLQGLMLKVK